jgi:beta-fructofuranosidase
MSLLEARAGWDGCLAFSVPEEIIDSFDEHVDVGLPPAGLEAPDGYSAVIGSESLPAQCYIRAEVEFEAGTTECGLLLRSSEDGDHGYVVRLEPRRDRMVFDRWPRSRTGPAQWQISGDVPHVIELERPADLTATSHLLEVVLDGDLAVIVLDRQVCLSTRLYDDTHDRLGIFVGEGAVKFQNLAVRRRCTT